jgi:hypothetical protein
MPPRTTNQAPSKPATIQRVEHHAYDRCADLAKSYAEHWEAEARKELQGRSLTLHRERNSRPRPQIQNGSVTTGPGAPLH